MYYHYFAINEGSEILTLGKWPRVRNFWMLPKDQKFSNPTQPRIRNFQTLQRRQGSELSKSYSNNQESEEISESYFINDQGSEISEPYKIAKDQKFPKPTKTPRFPNLIQTTKNQILNPTLYKWPKIRNFWILIHTAKDKKKTNQGQKISKPYNSAKKQGSESTEPYRSNRGSLTFFRYWDSSAQQTYPYQYLNHALDST